MNEFEIAKRYIEEYIDLHQPISTSIEIKYYNRSGIIPYGHNGRNFISFDDWKKLKRNNL
jgi:hypothetical protein